MDFVPADYKLLKRLFFDANSMVNSFCRLAYRANMYRYLKGVMIEIFSILKGI